MSSKHIYLIIRKNNIWLTVRRCSGCDVARKLLFLDVDAVIQMKENVT